MKVIILTWLMTLLFSFGSEEGSTEGWMTVDDRVMGGVSFSKLVESETFMRWEGTMSLESNGGFASVRSPWESGQIGKASSVTMRVRGSAGTFALRLATSSRYYDPIHQVGFEVEEEEWKTITWAMDDFRTTVMGRPTGGSFAKENTPTVGRIGIMKNDGNPGAFWLEVDFIRFD